jgi:hypothetical protein
MSNLHFDGEVTFNTGASVSAAGKQCEEDFRDWLSVCVEER